MTVHLQFPPGAVWIGSAHPFDLHEAYICFRAPLLTLDSSPGRAELLITADSRYKLWVNGRFVARGPARSWPDAMQVDRLDVAGFLQPGPNLIAVQVYSPGYSHFSYVHRAAAGLLAALVLDGDAAHPALVTDAAWHVRRDPSLFARVPRVSIYGSGVEHHDLYYEETWQHTGYDDRALAGVADLEWQQARVAAPAGGAPWTGLVERMTPLLQERDDILNLDVIYKPWVMEDAPLTDTHAYLRRMWADTELFLPHQAADGWLKVRLGVGKLMFWLFDLGRAHTFQARVEVEGAHGGEVLFVSYADKRKGSQVVISDPSTYCRVRLTDTFRLRPGDQVAEGFSLRGGRFLIVGLLRPQQGERSPGMRIRVRARIAEYPLAVTKPLAPQDKTLAQVVTMCENTVRACLQDGFVDCVWRESSQWVGDALPEALSLLAMCDDVRPLRQVLVQAAQGAYPDGILPSVVPAEVHAYTIPSYGFWWIELLRVWREHTGDDALVDELWPALVKLLDRFHADLRVDGLIYPQVGRRFYVDWSPMSDAQPNAAYNLQYAWALQRAAGLAAARGADEDAARWSARAASVLDAARAAFWDGTRWWDDRERTTWSQLTASFALLTGAAQPDEAPALLDAIAARSLDLRDEAVPGHMTLASPFMHHFVFEALRAAGRHAEAVEIIRRRWGRWAARFPTTWENWNVDFPDGSQCHAFSAHPRYHLAQIARVMTI